MDDFYLTEDGDLAVANNGDVAITGTPQEQIVQQCQMRLATQRGDFTVYPNIGASLQRMIGLPNTVDTARFGRSLIDRSLSYDNFVARGNIKTQATPTAPDIIMFEVKIAWGLKEFINITLNQILAV